MSRTRLLAAAMLVAGAVLPARAAAEAPNPVVTGPIAATAPLGDPSHAYPFFATNLDLAAQGYTEAEYFLGGTANRYDTPGQATGTVIDSGHPYKTRILVRRPTSPAKFNGTVVLEWQNVTNGSDQDQTFFEMAQPLLDRGYAWVGVSAQRAGVDALKAWSPSRYGSLDVTEGGTITNDALSYDIMSQAAQAIEHPAGVDPLGGLQAQTLIAIGHSQSASRLATYSNAIQPLSHSYDAFLLYGSLANRIRTDSDVPVFKINAEYDAALLEAPVRRPDDAKLVDWDVVGTSHNDDAALQFRRALERRDLGNAPEDTLVCDHPIGTKTVIGDAMISGLDKLVGWAHGGPPLPSAPPLQFQSGPPGPLARDAYGIALGGLRLPSIQAPIATSNGINTGGGTCDRWGYTEPFSGATLSALYPDHATYVAKVTAAAQASLAAGYIEQDAADRIIQEAKDSQIGTASTEVTGDVTASVPATLSLTLGTPASFGSFTPGVTQEYTASTTASVISSAGDATLTVGDPGHLVNGAFTLPEPLQVAFSKSTWTAPVSNEGVGVTFKQLIKNTDPLRTGTYSKTLTFTLATTMP